MKIVEEYFVAEIAFGSGATSALARFFIQPQFLPGSCVLLQFLTFLLIVHILNATRLL